MLRPEPIPEWTRTIPSPQAPHPNYRHRRLVGTSVDVRWAGGAVLLVTPERPPRAAMLKTAAFVLALAGVIAAGILTAPVGSGRERSAMLVMVGAVLLVLTVFGLVELVIAGQRGKGPLIEVDLASGAVRLPREGLELPKERFLGLEVRHCAMSEGGFMQLIAHTLSAGGRRVDVLIGHGNGLLAAARVLRRTGVRLDERMVEYRREWRPAVGVMASECGACGYSLLGSLEALRCPECGAVVYLDPDAQGGLGRGTLTP